MFLYLRCYWDNVSLVQVSYLSLELSHSVKCRVVFWLSLDAISCLLYVAMSIQCRCFSCGYAAVEASAKLQVKQWPDCCYWGSHSSWDRLSKDPIPIGAVTASSYTCRGSCSYCLWVDCFLFDPYCCSCQALWLWCSLCFEMNRYLSRNCVITGERQLPFSISALMVAVVFEFEDASRCWK